MRWKLVTWITIKATDMSDWLLRKRNWNFTADQYRAMPPGSMGQKLIEYMDKNNIPFKPNLVRHDLKHVLLGYEMKMPDELRIHAFLVGNRCYNPMAMVYLAVCIPFVPEIIPTLWKDFKRGKKSVCLRKIHLENYVTHDLKKCQQLWNLWG